MYKRLLYAITALFIVVVAWYFYAIQPVTHQSSPVQDFEVVSGERLDTIGQKLSEAKLIRSRAAFKITVLRLGIANKIQAGYFKLSPNMDIPAIVEKLTHAYALQVRVTIPEGLRRQEIALILSKAFDKDNPENNFDVNEFMKLTTSLEGHLFPDTYDFNPKSDAQTVVSRLTDNFQKVITDLKIPSDKLNNVVILASLLEREANPSEMPAVAGVLGNRLHAGWPLQVDATIQYAISSYHCSSLKCDWWPQDITAADEKIKSPYNTYLYPGLPPAPISNPGKVSLSAAASPQDTPYWFYLHDLQGNIHFSKTLEEHDRNVCTYLKKDCSQ